MQAVAQAEAAVLGTILAYPEHGYEVELEVSDFTGMNREVYAAIAELIDEGKPCDLLGVIGKVGTGRAAYLSDLTSAALPATMQYRVQDVRDASRRRRVQDLCQNTLASCEGNAATDELIGGLADGALALAANTAKSRPESISEFIGGALNDLDAMRRHQGLVGLSTTLHDLDNLTTGIRPGELWIVGALPGRGKTAFGLQIAYLNALHGVPAAIFSLEMSKAQLFHRLLANRSGLKAWLLRHPQQFTAENWQAITEAAADMKDQPLYVDDSSSLTTREIRARSRMLIRQHGVKLIVVDYLRLVTAPGRELRERVGEAANALRELAKTENVAVVALSQLRRPEDINDRPTMLHLKESGDIEAHAHTVLLLYQPVDSNGGFTHEDEIILGKQRNGPLGMVKTYFDERSLQFKERS